MAVGWAREGAVQEQIEATVEDAVQLARSRYQKVKVLSIVRHAKSKFRLPGGKQYRGYDYAFNVRKN